MRSLALLLALGCASAQPRPPACSAPAERVEVAQIQIGWNAVLTERPRDPPIVNMQNPQRYEREAEELAADLLRRCEKGEPLGPLQQRYSEVDSGTSLIDASSSAPYREAALCLRPGQCTLVRGPVAYHVLKRLN
jgi:hypothetical protein